MAAERPPNINELLPGCRPWLTHSGTAGGGDNEGAMVDDCALRCHPASSLVFRENQEARAWMIVEEIKRGVGEGDFHLRTRIAVHALKRHMDLKRSVSREARVVQHPLSRARTLCPAKRAWYTLLLLALATGVSPSHVLAVAH